MKFFIIRSEYSDSVFSTMAGRTRTRGCESKDFLPAVDVNLELGFGGQFMEIISQEFLV